MISEITGDESNLSLQLVRTLRERAMCGSAFIRESRADCETLHVIGEVDISNAAELESALVNAALSGEPVNVDLQYCTYLDMGGLAVLLRWKRRLGARLQVCVLEKSFISRIFHLAGASWLLA